MGKRVPVVPTEDGSDPLEFELEDNPKPIYREKTLFFNPRGLTFTDLFTQYPLVPAALLATISMLGFGVRAFSSGNSILSNYFMRGRVFFQCISIGAIIYALKDDFTYEEPPTIIKTPSYMEMMNESKQRLRMRNKPENTKIPDPDYIPIPGKR